MKKSRFTEEQIVHALGRPRRAHPPWRSAAPGGERADLLPWKRQFTGIGGSRCGGYVRSRRRTANARSWWLI